MINTRKYKYLRVRDNADFNTDIKEFVNSLELQYKVNIIFLPQWKELIELMNIGQTEYKRKLEKAENRKTEIIHKLLIQCYRASPFELTDKLSRTAGFWEKLKMKKPKLDLKNQDLFVPDIYDSGVIQSFSEKSNVDLTAHPNTEVMQSEVIMDIKSNKDLEQQIHTKSQEVFEIKSPPRESPSLPAVIYTNQHKLISSIGSEYSALNLKQELNQKSHNDLPVTVIKDSIELNQAKFIRCFPRTLIIINCPLREKSIKFILTNCSTEYVHIRFKTISDSSSLNFFTINPTIPIKLNPGLSRTYKFTYSLKENCNNSVIGTLYFRIGRTFMNDTSEEILCIPIINEFQKESVEVTETVNIPPAHAWQVTAKCGYPKGIVQICVKGDKPYNLHVRKRITDFTQEHSASVNSMEVVTPDTESLKDKVNDTDFESNIFTTPRATTSFEKITDDESVFTATDVVTFVLNVIVDLALESFIFKNTFLRLYPKSKRVIIVYFTKVEYIGYHHSYYDLIFTDPHNDEVIMNKTIKIFAEVLPHPIQIFPNILDMTKSPVIFGYCEDSIIVSNTHKFFTVTIKIKTTTRMKKIFQITPLESSVLPKSEVSFKVKMCTCHAVQKYIDNLAHFTIQIVVVGPRSVYHNVPPFFYEIITPCSTEFRKIYSQKYLTEKTESTE